MKNSNGYVYLECLVSQLTWVDAKLDEQVDTIRHGANSSKEESLVSPIAFKTSRNVVMKGIAAHMFAYTYGFLPHVSICHRSM